VPYEYSAEHHDWNMTLRSAGELYGLSVNPQMLGNGVRLFALLTGSMVLSFAAIESFSASVAFCMADNPRYPGFDFDRYKKTFRFAEKMNMLMEPHGIKPDWGSGLFQRIATMQQWRNLVTHASPYEIESTPIADSMDARHLHTQSHHDREYARGCNTQAAKDYYSTAVEYIEMIRKTTGINPVASATYTPVQP